MSRGGDGEWPSDRSTAGTRRPPPEIEWREEHGAQFYYTASRKTRVFRTSADMERWFKADHGDCTECGGTGFVEFEKRWAFNRGTEPSGKPRVVIIDAPCVRRCPHLPPVAGAAPRNDPSAGLTSATQAAPGWLPYTEEP